MGYDGRCPSCNKTTWYFREAFGSWKCYSCGLEKHKDTPSFDLEVRVANDWWNSLKNDEKLEFWRNSKKV
jgi:ribosomal protein L37AE/L43A